MNTRKSLSTTAEHLALDLRPILKGCRQSLTTDTGPVHVSVTRGGGTLMLNWKRPTGGQVFQSLDLVPRVLPFGGSAWWARCSCGARMTTLYLNQAGDTWGCRACLRLVYPSQRIHYTKAMAG